MNIITFNNLVNWRLFAKLLLILSVLFFIAVTAEAKEVKRGIQTAALQIGWTIVGGSGTCQGEFSGTQYPNVADGVYSAWFKSHSNSGSPLTLVPAGSSVLANPGTYVFKCTDWTSGKSDTDSLIVKDCDAGETWDGTTCKTPPAKPNLTVVSHTLPSGSIPKDQPVTLIGRAKNSGTVTTGAPFRTNFSYKIGGGSVYTSLNPYNTKPILGFGSSASQDSLGFTPTVAGSYTFQYCVDSDKVIDETSETDNCVSQAVTVSTGPTGSISVDSCEIADGASSCQALFTWTSNQASGVEKVDIDGNHTTWTAQSANNIARSVSYGTNGNHTAVLHVNGSPSTVIASTTFTTKCKSGSSWDGTKCAAIPSRIGSISATPCAIPNNGTICSSTVSWSSTNLVTPRVRHNVLIGFTANGSIARNVSPSNNTFTLSDDSDGTVIDTAYANVTCAGAPTWSWDGTKCANLPLPPQAGQCGPASRTYSLGETSFSGNLCNVGAVSPASPAFPAFGATTNWQCLGSNGGSDASCSATRATPPPPDFDLGDCSIGEELGNCSAGASWDLQAGTSPYSVKNLTNGASISNPASTSAGWLTLDYGTNEGEADATGIGALTDYGYANCANGLFWHNLINPKLCKRPPQISINPASSLVRKDDFAFIDVTVRATYTTKCDIVGGNPVPATFTFNGSISNPIYTQTVKTGPHKSTQVVEIECYVPGLPDIPGSHATATTRISVLPNYQEL